MSLLQNLKNHPFLQKLKEKIELFILFCFILLTLIICLTFFDKNYNSILGDPSRKPELSYEYFFAGFLVLWVLIFFILALFLLKKFLIKTESEQNNSLPLLRVLKKLEKILISFSIVVILVIYFFFFTRIFDLTRSISYSILILFLIIIAPIIFGIYLTKDDNHDKE